MFDFLANELSVDDGGADRVTWDVSIVHPSEAR